MEHEMTHEDLVAKQQEIQNKMREQFIADRALYEKQFNDWYADLLKSTELHKDIPFDVTGWKIEELCPELYVQYPREDVANQQMDELQNKIDQINAIVHNLNLAALEANAEFKAIGNK